MAISRQPGHLISSVGSFYRWDVTRMQVNCMEKVSDLHIHQAPGPLLEVLSWSCITSAQLCV